MKKIAILCGRYLPGYKDGGPVRTLINLVSCFGKEYNFKIITNDRDHGDMVPYPEISYDKPNKVLNADVWYLKPGGFTKRKILELTSDSDLVYVFGPFDDYAYKTMWLKRTGRIKQPVYIASMGSFSQGAFQIKRTKKELFIKMLKILGCFKKIIWSVTSNIEEIDVKRVIGYDAKCVIAEDLPRKVNDITFDKRQEKKGPLKLVFISRICKKKNLTYAIDILMELKCDIQFDIYGHLEDEEYWFECKKKIDRLPSNIKVNYIGIADSENVISIFSQYDVFLFPTLGENFGHVIFESLAGGCIPIISDQTPWNDLDVENCGRVLSLSNMESFSREIESISLLSIEELNVMKCSANQYAKKKYLESVNNSGYKYIFDNMEQI